MLIHPISKALYSKFCSAPAAWLNENLALVGKAALLIYRKVGREEAQTFIDLMRLCLIDF